MVPKLLGQCKQSELAALQERAADLYPQAFHLLLLSLCSSKQGIRQTSSRLMAGLHPEVTAAQTSCFQVLQTAAETMCFH